MTAMVLVMPLLVLNLASEMVFALDHRLRIKRLPAERIERTLESILLALHAPAFIAELFRPQPLTSPWTTRALFGRLANASAMSLNASNIDALYDLMRMSFKHQVVTCASADELLQITMAHLDATKRVVDSEAVRTRVDGTILLTAELYADLSPADFVLLRQLLCRFLQDVRRRTDVLVHAGAQLADGSLRVTHDGPTCTGGRVPGSVRYYGEDGSIAEVEAFEIASASGSVESSARPMLERAEGRTPLGSDLHDVHAGGQQQCCKSVKQVVAEATRRLAPDDRSAATRRAFKATASDALGLLADLMGASATAARANGRRPFRLNLWTEAKGEKDEDEDDGGVETIWIDASSDRKETDALRDEWDDWADSKSEGKHAHDEDDGNGDDLLRLMDAMT